MQTIAIDLVIFPLPYESSSYLIPLVKTYSMFEAFEVFTSVNGTVFPSFLALSLLHTIIPFSLVHRATTAVHVLALAIDFVLTPSTFIHVTIGKFKQPLNCWHAETPHALVRGSILPRHRAVAVSEPSEPLSIVNGSSSVLVFRSLFERARLIFLKRFCKVKLIVSFQS